MIGGEADDVVGTIRALRRTMRCSTCRSGLTRRQLVALRFGRRPRNRSSILRLAWISQAARCFPLARRADGTPLCLLGKLCDVLLARSKLWELYLRSVDDRGRRGDTP